MCDTDRNSRIDEICVQNAHQYFDWHTKKLLNEGCLMMLVLALCQQEKLHRQSPPRDKLLFNLASLKAMTSVVTRLTWNGNECE